MKSLVITLILAGAVAFTFLGMQRAAASDERSDAAREKYPEEVVRKKLTPTQFDVTMKNGTEPAFRNAYHDNHEPGLYVDVISGQPLFSSTDKFDSGTGWPSFTKPLAKDEVVEKKDVSYGMVRTEVRSKTADAHLGHIFDDGPEPTGLRYCINSAALDFVPVTKFKEKGFQQYLALFEKK